MAKNDNKKVPGALIAIVAVIVAVAVFVPTVYMPYKNKKPVMDSEHQEAVDTIQMWEDAILNQVAIEKDIEELEAEWEQFQKDYFVDAASSLDDLEAAISEYNFHYISFNRGNETADESGKLSYVGRHPLYYVTIKLSGYSNREDLIDFLNFVEKESVGCYYVKKFSATTIDTDSDLGEFQIHADDLSVSMEIYLYYYNQKIQVAVTESDTAA